MKKHISTNERGVQHPFAHLIPLQAKRVGELIEIGQKKISPTRILGTLGFPSLCDSVTLSPISPLLTQQPAMGLSRKVADKCS